ncbi:MAG: hypothetical protein ACXAB7_24865 [Candidatus Kariarchaeaceae archaeon]|jgi:hypothetical protein
MSEAMFDMTSWKRAFGPALRTFGYLATLYILLFLLILAPAYAIGGAVYTLAGQILAILMVFAIFLAFFKVLDEERPGAIPLDVR